MGTVTAELEARVRKLESRSQRHDEDMTTLMDTVLETHEDVKELRRDVLHLTLGYEKLTRRMRAVENHASWTRRGIRALLVHQGITLGPDDKVDESEDDDLG